MATRIAFSTVYPDRMKDLAGKPTYFPEKILYGLELTPEERYKFAMRAGQQGGYFPNLLFSMGKTKTTTIRSNYDYWKSKEGQLLQPFFWAGKPYRSKHVVFCPEVRLKAVKKIEIHNFKEIQNKYRHGYILDHIRVDKWWLSPRRIEELIQNEGFDHPDHFWRWFDSDFDGALLELQSA